MDSENLALRRRLPRCGVCKLPSATLAEVERERFAWGASYDALAEKLRSSGHTTSTSALRRHFRSHARALPDDGPNAPGSPAGEDITTPFDTLVGAPVDDRRVAEAVVQVLLEQLQRVERARRATRDGVQADRLGSRSLKQLTALDRALRRWQDIRQPREELRAKFRETLNGIAEAAGMAARTFMADHVGLMENAVEEHLRDYDHPERLVRRLREFQNDWPKTFGSRLIEAVKGASDELTKELR
jgi:hypothetical protein